MQQPDTVLTSTQTVPQRNTKKKGRKQKIATAVSQSWPKGTKINVCDRNTNLPNRKPKEKGSIQTNRKSKQKQGTTFGFFGSRRVYWSHGRVVDHNEPTKPQRQCRPHFNSTAGLRNGRGFLSAGTLAESGASYPRRPTQSSHSCSTNFDAHVLSTHSGAAVEHLP